ncbi:MAG TPA: hypothetical protein VHV10_16300 [Ktedonobacteraceae bacterium]|jgi:hypothetical protein|nr:hypothetical protein [Ktedonobacteraceae bacterium]
MRQLKQEAYNVLSYREAEQLIQECFNKPDYQIAEGWSNDSAQVFDVRIADFDEWIERDVKRFETENYNVSVYWLLFALCARQEIPEGKYLIEICW